MLQFLKCVKVNIPIYFSQTVKVKYATMEEPWTTTLVPANVHLHILEAPVKIVSL